MTTTSLAASRTSYPWALRGDINAFFGLMLDNIGGMILMAGLLVEVFGFPADFVLPRMIPGTAVGVLVGDLIYTVMAFRLARRLGRSDVTAMPLGLDTPSTFGMVFLVLGPAFLHARGVLHLAPAAAARHAWFVGMAMLLASGLFKLSCAPFCGWLRRVLPRAGLLGSLAAIALVLISFLPLLDIAATPIAGFAAMAVILATLTARWSLPKAFPGALGAVLLGCLIYYGALFSEPGAGLRSPARASLSGGSAPADPGMVELVRGLLARGAGIPAGGDPAGAGDRRRRHRLHRERRGGRR